MATNQIPQIKAQPRERLGSRYAARLRDQGRLPAVIYGHQQDAVHVSVGRDEMVEILHANAHLIELQIDSQTEPCLIKDVQWDSLGARIIHVDLTRVDLTEQVTVEVNLEVYGEPAALQEEGAILEHPLSVIEIQCLATQIPESIRVDVSHLKVDEQITVADLKLPEEVTTTADPETVVATITVIAETEEAAPVEAGAAEPEVIGRPAAEGEEAEA